MDQGAVVATCVRLGPHGRRQLRRRPSHVSLGEAAHLLEATPVGVLAGEGEAAVPEAEEAGPASQNTPGVPAPPSSHHPFSQSNVERTKSSCRSASCPEDVVSEFAITALVKTIDPEMVVEE